jgi:hypothetical protein
MGRTGSSDRRGIVKLCPVCEKFRVAAIKGIQIAICVDCLAKTDKERVTLGDKIRKQRKEHS